MTPAEREAAALEAVQEVWPDAKLVSSGVRVAPSVYLTTVNSHAGEGYMLDTNDVGYCSWSSDALRAVLRALDILNGKDGDE